MHKDVRLAFHLGTELRLPMFLRQSHIRRELYQTCISELGQGDEVNTAALIMDRLAGTEVVLPDTTTS